VAIPTVTTLVAGDKFTATRHAELRTLLAFLLSPPEAVVANTAGTSIANNTETVIPFATETVDTGPTWDGAMHDTATNNSRITITTTGRYDIDGMVAFGGNVTGRRVANLRKNAAGTGGAGTLLRAFAWPSTLTATDVCYLPVRTTETLAAGDHVEIFGFQTSGGSLALSTAAGGNYLRARLVGS
jgi:hypothetical protein